MVVSSVDRVAGSGGAEGDAADGGEGSPSRRQFEFKPLDRRPIWRNLALTMSQASALTGASERQIQHWMDRGYISSSSKGTRKLNGESLDLIMLIRQARAAGVPLRQAVALARQYLRQEESRLQGMNVTPSLLIDVEEQLQAMRDRIEALQGTIRRAAGRDRVE
jgi:DNA-binding transcriptional MerR regulator